MSKTKDKLNKDTVCFIRTMQRHGDYVHQGIKKMGYKIIIPYKDYNLIFRVMREIWFKLKFPMRFIWYNPEVKYINSKIYFVKDPLMTVDYLKWLRREKPDARIILDFDNRAGIMIDPNDIDDPSIEKWSYDPDDCIKYRMYLKPKGYLDCYRIQKSKKSEYDIVFVGRDKGRANALLNLEKKFHDLNLRTYFRISPDRSFFLHKKKFYKPIISYEDYLSIISKSEAILNIMPDGQRGLTLREYEAVFDGIKCITTNKTIKDFELYDSSRYFVLGEDRIESIIDFLKMPFIPVDDTILSKYTFDKVISSICRNTI